MFNYWVKIQGVSDFAFFDSYSEALDFLTRLNVSGCLYGFREGRIVILAETNVYYEG